MLTDLAVHICKGSPWQLTLKRHFLPLLQDCLFVSAFLRHQMQHLININYKSLRYCNSLLEQLNGDSAISGIVFRNECLRQNLTLTVKLLAPRQKLHFFCLFPQPQFTEPHPQSQRIHQPIRCEGRAVRHLVQGENY